MWKENGDSCSKISKNFLGCEEGKLSRQWEHPGQGNTQLWNKSWVWPAGWQSYMRKWGNKAKGWIGAHCKEYFFLIFEHLFYTGIQLINSVEIVSGGQQRDSAIHILASILPQEPCRSSLAVQCLRLHVPNAGGMGSVPSQGTKILRVVRCNW